MKYPATILATLCLSLSAFSQMQTLPVLRTNYARSNSGDALVPSSQDSYQYDKDGRVRLYKSYTWFEEEKRWALYYSEENNYDDLGNLNLQTSTYWHAQTDTIDRIRTVTQKFDSQNRLIEYAIIDEQPLPGFKSISRYTYTYDNNGCNNEVRFKYTFDETVYESVTVNVMDEQCRLFVIRSYPTAVMEGPHESTVYTYEGNKEVLRRLFHVDVDSTLVEEHFFYYDQYGRVVLDQWTNVGRVSYEYDNAGNITHQLYEGWDSETMSWERSAEYRQTFDSEGKLLFRESHSSPAENNSWQYSQFETFEYDNEGKLLKMHYRVVYNFNSLEEFRLVREYSYRCDGFETQTTDSILQGANSGLSSRSITVYNHPAGCDNDQNSSIIIFPNPTSGFVRLLLPDAYNDVTIHMISSNGQLADVLTTDTGINPIELDISNLAYGVYLVKVISEGFSATSRIVKK